MAYGRRGFFRQGAVFPAYYTLYITLYGTLITRL